MSTFGKICWFPGGLGILLWMSVWDGNLLLVPFALFLTPFVLANLIVMFFVDLFKKIF